MMNCSRGWFGPMCRAIISKSNASAKANRHVVVRWLLASQDEHQLQQQQRRHKSSAFPDFPIPESFRESVKTTLLDEALRDDSRWWSKNVQTNGHNARYDRDVDVGSHSIDSPINGLHDPLDDLYIQQATRHWPNLPPHTAVGGADPFQLAQVEINDISRSIREDLVGTDHPVLNKAASYFFDSADGGKKVRPMMVLLLSRALSETFSSEESAPIKAQKKSLLSAPFPGQRPDLPQAQRRLAEISEMIHTASLFHDDVIDGASTRRGVPAVHTVFGNKMAILAGDYLLARASICLARLRDVRVVETMSTIIEHLVRGEVMQMRGTNPDEHSSERIVYYLQKNYYKTASLMANSCRSAALLGDYPHELVDASYRYGKHVGMAFQLVDDVLDFEGTLSQLGKPSLADLKAGLATAPVLFAAEEYPELGPFMDRKFKEDGDVDAAVRLVFSSDGIERTKQLARVHAEYAMDAILEQLRPSEHRDSLIHLAHKVVARTK